MDINEEQNVLQNIWIIYNCVNCLRLTVYTDISMSYSQRKHAFVIFLLYINFWMQISYSITFSMILKSITPIYIADSHD